MTMFATPRNRRRTGIVVALCTAALLQLATGAQIRRFEPAELLDAYGQGRYDEVVGAVHQASRDRMQDLRQEVMFRGRQWVELVPENRRQRALTAAAFVLEAERIRVEKGEWRDPEQTHCDGRCMIEWACTLLQASGAPDSSERIWMEGSIALAGGVRDWAFLQTPLGPPSERSGERGHVHHALARFPGHPRFRLARAIALTARSSVTTEMEMPREGVRTAPAPSRAVDIIPLGGGVIEILEQRRTGSIGYGRQELQALISDPSIGDEAQIRLGYLNWVQGSVEQALAAERAAADVTKDPDLKYLANFLAGQASQALGDLSASEAHYRAALAARPHSQSATLGLAALLYLRGEGSQAFGLAEATAAARPRDDDPWRMFLYGDFPKLPRLISELRQGVRK
jgi:hypothetical protein